MTLTRAEAPRRCHPDLRISTRLPFPNGQSVRVAVVRLIGYWRPGTVDLDVVLVEGWRTRWPSVSFVSDEEREASKTREREQERRWPDVHDFVDPTWDEQERRVVSGYLGGATRVNQSRGLSACRFCSRQNGSAERTDGVYCWPEGLAHYVVEHSVRLPGEFVAHVLSSLHRRESLLGRWFDDLRQWLRRDGNLGHTSEWSRSILVGGFDSNNLDDVRSRPSRTAPICRSVCSAHATIARRSGILCGCQSAVVSTWKPSPPSGKSSIGSILRACWQWERPTMNTTSKLPTL